MLRNLRMIFLTVAVMLLLAACGGGPVVSTAQENTSTPPAASGQQATVASPAGQPTAAQAPTPPTVGSTGGSAAPTQPAPKPPKTGIGWGGTVRTAAPAAPSAATATPKPEPPALPVRFIVDTPDVKMNAAVEYVGLTKDGAMDVPKKWENVAWYKGGPPPGQPGNSVIAGHYDSDTGPAIFYRLKDLKPGDIVSVVTDKGTTLRYKVRKSEVYNADNAPLLQIFGPAEGGHLNLITCDGAWIAGKGQYDKRLVVYTDQIGG